MLCPFIGIVMPAGISGGEEIRGEGSQHVLQEKDSSVRLVRLCREAVLDAELDMAVVDPLAHLRASGRKAERLRDHRRQILDNEAEMPGAWKYECRNASYPSADIYDQCAGSEALEWIVNGEKREALGDRHSSHGEIERLSTIQNVGSARVHPLVEGNAVRVQRERRKRRLAATFARLKPIFEKRWPVWRNDASLVHAVEFF